MRDSFQRISVEVDGETAFRSGFFGYPAPKTVAGSVEDGERPAVS